MLALAIVLSVLVLLALLRFGLIFEYDKTGLHVWVKLGFLKFSVPEDQKEQIKKKQRNIDLKKMKPGSLSDFMDILKAVGNALKRLRRRLLIKELTIHYTAASDDPANTAIYFGSANALFGTIIPVLERNFRIKSRDLQALADFDTKEQSIYAKANVSLAVWEAFYIIFALFPIFTSMFSGKAGTKNDLKNRKDRKDGCNNGESPDQ